MEPKLKGIINPETVSALKEEIQYLWEVYKIDPSFRQSFFDSIAHLQPKLCVEALAKEIQNLYNEKAEIQILISQIQRREKLVADIKLLSENLVKEKIKINKEIQENIKKQMEILRLNTLYVVELAMTIKRKFEYKEPLLNPRQECIKKPVPIIYENKHYLAKIANDYYDISSGALSNIIAFGNTLDPLFLVPSQPFQIPGKHHVLSGQPM